MGFGDCLGAGSRREVLGRAGQNLTAWIPKYANPILLHRPYRPQTFGKFRNANKISKEIRRKSNMLYFNYLWLTQMLKLIKKSPYNLKILKEYAKQSPGP